MRCARFYDDPQLRQKKFYMQFLRKLKKAGILTFSRSAARRSQKKLRV